MYPKTKHVDGVPDDIVVNIASRFVEKAWQRSKGIPPISYRAIWLPRIKIKDEDN